VESVTLTVNQTPLHNHAWFASRSPGSSPNPLDNVLADGVSKIWRAGAPSDPMAPNVVTPVGGSQPHENLQPYLTISYIISLYGVFPTQS
jgi:microcystin-dependent protein